MKRYFHMSLKRRNRLQVHDTFAKSILTVGVIGLGLLAIPAFAQDNNGSASFKRHTLTLGAAAARAVTGESESKQEIGSDYLYRFNPRWELGVQAGVIFTDGFEAVDGFTLVSVVSYSVTSEFPLFGGVGLDYQKWSDDYDLLLRAGCEYTFYFDQSQLWTFLPGGFVDLVGGHFAVSAVLAFGHSF
jgi:hypothetical protein